MELFSFLVTENADDDVAVVEEGFNDRVLVQAKVAHDIGVDLDVETINWLVLHVVTFEIKQSQLAALLVQVKLIGCCLLLEIVVGNQQFLI